MISSVFKFISKNKITDDCLLLWLESRDESASVPLPAFYSRRQRCETARGWATSRPASAPSRLGNDREAGAAGACGSGAWAAAPECRRVQAPLLATGRIVPTPEHFAGCGARFLPRCFRFVSFLTLCSSGLLGLYFQGSETLAPDLSHKLTFDTSFASMQSLLLPTSWSVPASESGTIVIAWISTQRFSSRNVDFLASMFPILLWQSDSFPFFR